MNEVIDELLKKHLSDQPRLVRALPGILILLFLILIAISLDIAWQAHTMKNIIKEQNIIEVCSNLFTYYPPYGGGRPINILNKSIATCNYNGDVLSDYGKPLELPIYSIK